MNNLICRSTEVLDTNIFAPFVPTYHMRENLFADLYSDPIVRKLADRVYMPSTYDEDILLAIRDHYSDLWTYSFKDLSDNQTLYLMHLLDNLSVVNLSKIGVGQIPEQSFQGSLYLTFCLEGRKKLTLLKKILAKDPYIQCMFNNYLGFDLIVILKLDAPIEEYDVYKLVFEYYAKKYENKYELKTLNFDNPLAFFYISWDEKIYTNWNVKEIPVKKTLRLLHK